MTFSLSEHRLIRYTPEQLAKMGVTTTGAKPLSSTPKANVEYQNKVRQSAISTNQQKAQTVNVPGGLTKSQYSRSETEQFKLPDGNTVDLPKGSNPTVPGGTRLPDGTTTPETTPVAQPRSYADFTKPPPTGEQIQSSADALRKQRMSELNIDEDKISYVDSLLERGYQWDNSTFEGRPVFRNPNNKSDYIVADLNEEQLKNINAIRNTDFQKEIQGQNAMQEQQRRDAEVQRQKALKSAVGDTSQGTSGITGESSAAKIPMRGPDYTMFDAQMAQVNAMLESDPNLAATYTPQIMGLMQKRIQIENDFASSMSSFNAQDKDNDGVADGVQVAYGQGVEASERRANEADRINLENRNINLEAANIAKEMAEISQKKFALEQHRNEQLVLENNIEMERKNRLIANKLGIASGGNGMRWMADEVRKGTEALAYLQEAGSLQEATFALETGKTYALNVRQATNNYDSQKMQIDTQFSSDIAELNKMVNLDAKERKEEKKSLTKDYLDSLDKVDTEFARQVSEFNKEMATGIREASKLKREGAQNARDYLKGLRGEIKNDDTLKDFKAISSKFSQMELAYNMLQNGEIDAGTADQALITLFNKMLDPTSVVREGEYLRTEEQQGLFRQIKGNLLKAWNGGAAIDPAARQSIVDLSRAIMGEYNKRAQEALEPLQLDIIDYNRDNPDNAVDISRAFNMDAVFFDDVKLNQLEDIYTSVTGGTPSHRTPPVNISAGSPMIDGVITGYGSPAWDHGLDIATGGKPSPVRAHMGGEVVSTVFDESWKGSPNDPSGKKQNSGFGNQVKVKFDDGTEGWFSHLSAVDVGNGQRIESGQLLGMVGNTGYTLGSTGYHLDLTVVKEYKNGNPVYMSPQEVAVWMRGNGTSPSVAQTTPPTKSKETSNMIRLPGINAPMGSGSLPLSGNSVANAGTFTPPKPIRYRNLDTGAAVEFTPAPGKEDPYAARPYQFSPIS